MLEQEPGRYLITQRSAASSLPLLWEFPGGRVEEGENDEDALVRELKGRLAIDVDVLDQVMATHHTYPNYDIDFHVFRCRMKNPEQPVSHAKIADHRFAKLDEMGQFRFPDADSKTLAKLLDLDD